MPYDDRTAYRLVFDDNGADMMTPGPGWCRASKVVRVEPDTGGKTSTMEGGLFRWDLLTKTTLMRLLLRSPLTRTLSGKTTTSTLLITQG